MQANRILPSNENKHLEFRSNGQIHSFEKVYQAINDYEQKIDIKLLELMKIDDLVKQIEELKKELILLKQQK